MADEEPKIINGEWVEYYDENHQRPYYFNINTNETLWVLPGMEGDDDASDSTQESGVSSDHDVQSLGDKHIEEEVIHESGGMSNPLSAASPRPAHAAATPVVPQPVAATTSAPILTPTSTSFLHPTEDRDVVPELETRDRSGTMETTMTVKTKKLGKSLTAHRLAKGQAQADSGLPNLPSLAKPPAPPSSTPSFNKSASAMSSMSNPSVSAPQATNPAPPKLNNPMMTPVPELTAQSLLDGIRDMSAFSLIIYAKSHFRIPKARLLKKAKSVDELLRWRAKPLTKPLHARLPKQTGQEAIRIFSYIMAFMGDKSISDPDPLKLIVHILHEMVRDKDIRDEIFCQLCKQTTSNPKFESMFKGWQLIAIVCGVVHPSPEFQKYFEQFLDAHVSRTDGVGQLASFAKSRLGSTIKQGCRRYVPCRDELNAVRSQKPLIVRVYLLDDTYKTIAIESSLTNKEMCEIVAEKIRLRDGANFSLFEYQGLTENRMFRDHDVILDAFGRWAYEDERAERKKEIKPDEVGKRFKLVFKPKLVLNSMEDVSDPACIDLLFVQAVFHVLAGNYSTTAEDAVKMAALQLQAAYGDYDPANITKGLVSSRIEKYIPQTWLPSRSPEDWEKVVFELHQRFSGRTGLDAKLHYLSYVKKRPLYGASFYHVKHRNQFRDVPEAVVMAINQEGVQLLKPGITKERIASYPFSEIVSWAFTGQTYTFVTGDLAEQKKYTVETTRGFEMSAVCQGYVNALLEASM